MTVVKTKVLIDADVLFSRTLRDWILLMSDSMEERSSYSVYWTEDILAETVARLRDERPDINSGRLEEIGDRLRKFWPTGRISGFDPSRDTFIGQDEGDLHVHSAAVAGGIDVVITNDTTGLFAPLDSLLLMDDLPYEIQTADHFLSEIYEQSPLIVRDCIRRQLKYYLEKRDEVDLPGRLRNSKATHFADHVRQVLQTLDMKKLNC